MNESLGIDSFEPIQVVSVEKTWFLSNFKLGHHFLFQALKFSKLLEPFIKKIVFFLESQVIGHNYLSYVGVFFLEFNVEKKSINTSEQIEEKKRLK